METGATPVLRRTSSAFTMVEIAISLAVIAFALVAIIGVLPHGLNVQRENREETIINQDASVFLSALRNGARGMDDLTNYVYAIENWWTFYEIDYSANPATTNVDVSGVDRYGPTNSVIQSIASPPVLPLTNGLRIIGLMSRPKYELFPDNAVLPTTLRSNFVVAYVRAMSGVAAEKPPQDNADVQADAFSYRLICENQSTQVYTEPASAQVNHTNYHGQLVKNLRELRLTFRWPLSIRGIAGNGRQTFRLAVGGNLDRINDPYEPQHPLFFFRPTTFVKAELPPPP